MQAGHYTLEVVTTILIGNSVAAILKHHADACYALGFARINRAAAVCNAAYHSETLTNAVADNPHRGIDGAAAGTAQSPPSADSALKRLSAANQ